MKFKFNNIIFKILVVLALSIVGVTLWYTNNLANKFKEEEKKKVALWAKATKILSNINDVNDDIGFVFEVVNNNTTVPVIQVNEDGEIIAHRNIKNVTSDIALKEEIESMKRKYPPIEIELVDGKKEYIYYKDSKLLQNLKYFPVFMLSIIGAFMLIVYFAFSNARIAQQNKVWTGMAKETAHQIGTPLSSLMGWVAYLKENMQNQSITQEIEKDINRLSVIASRFSKIGSLPKLEYVNIIPILEGSIRYMKQRASSKILFELISKKNVINTKINKDLFEWVIENIIKNSIDAINEKGKVVITVKVNDKHIFIDIADNGRGVSKSFFHAIFEPGFTSKKRGWGLGLSLVKRIIKDYHQGRIDLIKSTPYQETLFRIVLKK
jgi:two-component system, sporulation sensor kinase D